MTDTYKNGDNDNPLLIVTNSASQDDNLCYDENTNRLEFARTEGFEFEDVGLQFTETKHDSDAARLYTQDSIRRRTALKRQQHSQQMEESMNGGNGVFRETFSASNSSTSLSILQREFNHNSIDMSVKTTKVSIQRCASWSNLAPANDMIDFVPMRKRASNPDISTMYQYSSNLDDSFNSTRTFTMDNDNYNDDEHVSDNYHGYSPPIPHWFYHNAKDRWIPFSYIDNENLESEYLKLNSNKRYIASILVPTDGRRYDVDLKDMKRCACYWNEDKLDVQRCTWFYKGDADINLVPFSEKISELLEQSYKDAILSHKWNHRVELPDGDSIVFHSPSLMVHYRHSHDPISWIGEDAQTRPKTVCRGIIDIKLQVPEGEPSVIDHLVFVVHGIGNVADLQGRNIFEAVDLLRDTSLRLMKSHQFAEEGVPLGRVEFIPIEWHHKLRLAKGINERLESISLPSLAKLRQFSNETCSDCFLYTSPIFCQKIVDTVVEESNLLRTIFMSRNPEFSGNISVCGHSLGTLILFDVLTGQKPISKKFTDRRQYLHLLYMKIIENVTPSLLDIKANVDYHRKRRNSSSDHATIDEILSVMELKEWAPVFHDEHILDKGTLAMCSDQDLKDIGIPLGPRKKILKYLSLTTGSSKPEDIKSYEKRVSFLPPVDEVDANLSTSARYRKGTMMKMKSVDKMYHQAVSGTGQPLVSYKKLDFSPAHMFAMGSPLGLFLTIRGIHMIGCDFKLPTCDAFFNLFHPDDPMAYRLEPLINPAVKQPPKQLPHYKGRKRIHLEIRDRLLNVSENLRRGVVEMVRSTFTSFNQMATSTHRPVGTPEEFNEDKINDEWGEKPSSSQKGDIAMYGNLNGGRRVDYVLQEKPLESLNEYLSSINSHTCYWASEDIVLVMLTEIYRSIYPDIYKHCDLPRIIHQHLRS